MDVSPEILVVLDAGYDAPRIAHLLADLPVQILGRMRSDRVLRCWQAFLRRFDVEHTFRLFTQTLGWTRPRLRSPEAADRWTWLVIVAHTQLRLARSLVADLRRPGNGPLNRPD